MKHTTIIKTLPLLFLSLHFSHLNASDHTARSNNGSILPNTPKLTREERLRLDQIEVMKKYFTPTEQSRLKLDKFSSFNIKKMTRDYYIQGMCKLSSLLENPYAYNDQDIYQLRILDTLLSKKSNLSLELVAYADTIYYSFTEPVTILFPVSIFIEAFKNPNNIYDSFIQNKKTISLSLSIFIEAFINKLATPQDFESAIKAIAKINSIGEFEQFLKKELDHSNIQIPYEEAKYKFISKYFKKAPLSSNIRFSNERYYEQIMANIGETLTSAFSSLEEILPKNSSSNKRERNRTELTPYETKFINDILSGIGTIEFTVKNQFIKDGYKFNFKRDFFDTRYTNQNQFNQNMKVFWSPNDSINDKEIFSLAEAVQRFYSITELYKKDPTIGSRSIVPCHGRAPVHTFNN